MSNMIKAGPYLIPPLSILYVEATAEGGALVHVAGGETLALLPEEVPAVWELGSRGRADIAAEEPRDSKRSICKRLDTSSARGNAGLGAGGRGGGAAG